MAIKLEIVEILDRGAWRRWLEKNHECNSGIWLVFHKKHTGKNTLIYPDARDEALCFGWIDSIVKRLDDDRYLRKFTPRTNPQKWSDLNIRCMRQLIREGKMTDAGLRVFDVHQDAKHGLTAVKEKISAEAPAFMEEAIASSRKAERFWSALPAGSRRRYIAWVLDAKREETRKRRLLEALKLLEAGTRDLLK
jgi:uncharacterized protein YdeI (YjbR/CyaY-like superfamily)